MSQLTRKTEHKLIHLRWNKNCFRFYAPLKGSEVSIIPPDKKKEGNLPISQEKDEREKNTKPQLQAITTFCSQHGEMICCPFRGSSGLAQHRHPLLPCVSLWRWLIPSFGGDKRRGG